MPLNDRSIRRGAEPFEMQIMHLMISIRRRQMARDASACMKERQLSAHLAPQHYILCTMVDAQARYD